jgi:hypothetical protein
MGAALGTQIAAALVISAGVVGKFPAEQGFTRAFSLGLLAAVVALVATAAVPAARRDPLVARVENDRASAPSRSRGHELCFSSTKSPRTPRHN